MMTELTLWVPLHVACLMEFLLCIVVGHCQQENHINRILSQLSMLHGM